MRPAARSPADHSARPMRPPARVNSFAIRRVAHPLADHRRVQRLLAAWWRVATALEDGGGEVGGREGTPLAEHRDHLVVEGDVLARRGGARPLPLRGLLAASTRALALVRPLRASACLAGSDAGRAAVVPAVASRAASRASIAAISPSTRSLAGRPDSRLRAPHRFAPRPTAGPGRPAACQPRRRAA